MDFKEKDKTETQIQEVMAELNRIYTGKYKFEYTPLKSDKKPLEDWTKSELLELIKHTLLIAYRDINAFQLTKWRFRGIMSGTLATNRAELSLVEAIKPLLPIVQLLIEGDAEWAAKYRDVISRKIDVDVFLKGGK
jgi:hypothetical protein